MSIKLLPVSVDSVDPSRGHGISPGLVPLTGRAIAPRTSQSVGPSAEAFAWSSSTRRGEAFIHGTPVEDSQSDQTGHPVWEYLSGWAWSRLRASTVVNHYLSYAAGPGNWSGQLVDVYA